MDNLLDKNNRHIFLDSNRGDNVNSFIANVNLIANDFDAVREIGKGIAGLDEKVEKAFNSAVEAAKSAELAANAVVEAQNIAYTSINGIRNATDTSITSIREATVTITLKGEQLVARAKVEADRAENIANSLQGFITAAGQRTFVGLVYDPVTTELSSVTAVNEDFVDASNYLSLELLPREARYFILNGDLRLELPFTI